MTSTRTATDPAARLAAIESQARRFETPCGEGALVWHSWGKGPPLLLFHGSYGSWTHWIANIPALAERYTLWVPDLPGQGDSADPPGEDGRDHGPIIRVLADGVRRLIGDGQAADLAGFSWGGVVGAHFAAAYPELVRKVVVIGTGGLETPMGPVDLKRVRGLEGEERQEAVRFNLLALLLHDRASADALAIHTHELNTKRGRINAKDYVLPDRLIEVLPHIRGPVAAIWGEFDAPHFDPAAQEAVLRRYRPELKFRTIEGAGHWAQYERPEAFNQALFEVLA